MIKFLRDKLWKKRILFPVIFLAEIFLFAAIDCIFDIEQDNFCFDFICAFIFSGTIIWFLVRILKDHKNVLSNKKMPGFEILGMSVAGFIYFIIIIIIVSFIIATLVVVLESS